MTAASVLEYIFITVTCCKEIAKKLFQHFLQLFTHDVQFLRIFWDMHTHHCQANSTTFQDLALPRTKLIFQDFPGPGNFTNTIPGLSRCGNPAASTWSKQSKTISNQPQQLTCHMGSHSLTCHPADLTFLLLPQQSCSTWFSDLRGTQGWVDLVGWLHTEMDYPPANGHPSQY